MNRFKVGDWVIRNGDPEFFNSHGGSSTRPYKIEEIEYDKTSDSYSIILKDATTFQWEAVLFEPVPLDNPLNRKLYPNRVGWEGYLLPREIAEKMIEQSSHREEEK